MLTQLKQDQRRQAYDARNAQTDKKKLSETICQRFIGQSEYQQAQTIMWYVHCRSEVKTLTALTSELSGNKRLVVPYCTSDMQGQKILGLWLLKNISELIPGTWGILEPPIARWREQGREILPDELDLIMVPGVAFDRLGGRLGNGAGYYDRLFKTVRSDTRLIAVCYESQVFEKVVMEKHDVYMDAVLTENSRYGPDPNGFEFN